MSMGQSKFALISIATWKLRSLNSKLSYQDPPAWPGQLYTMPETYDDIKDVKCMPTYLCKPNRNIHLKNVKQNIKIGLQLNSILKPVCKTN